VKRLAGDPIQVPIYDSAGNVSGYKTESKDIVLDSFFKFRIKEEVVFDKESSRLFWRILGIAPLFNKYTAQTNQLVGADQVAFWVYYPDLRPTLGRYKVYNGKNYGLNQSWEELFENRMFSGRIVKSSVDNPFDKYIDEIPGLKGNGVFQLLEGERIKEKIFNYELDLWSY
jgi:gliding motility associated protien GldN